MANIKNLFVNGVLPKNIWHNGQRVKNVYINDVLVWKNSDYLAFVKTLDPTKTYEANTIVFEGFSETDFMSEYRTVDSASEIDLSETGQVYVQEVEDEEN